MSRSTLQPLARGAEYDECCRKRGACSSAALKTNKIALSTVIRSTGMMSLVGPSISGSSSGTRCKTVAFGSKV